MYITILNYSIPKIFVNIKITKKELKLLEDEQIFYDENGNNIYKESTCYYITSKKEIEVEF